MSPIERFEAKYIPEPNSGCWLWIGALDSRGYGCFNAANNRIRKQAYYFAYLALKGPVPDGLELDHKCRVRCCVNPDHLEPVTHEENLRRAAGGGRGFFLKRTHCPVGHPYDEQNTYSYKGRTDCRACRSAAGIRHRAKLACR